jgi:hypothetical protein
MSSFEFISHERYPEDQYIAESAVVCVEGKYRVTFIRKIMKNGGRFWDEIGCSVTVNGEKKYIKAFKADSNFLRDDIIAFLNKGNFSKGQASVKDDQLPF